jgi:ABC-type Zn uptake system ZnuABC Zn-binding protein ZnuA
LARRLQDYDLVRQLNQAKDKDIANLEKDIEYLNKESELKDKLIAVIEREVESTRRALNDMKEIADRSLELAKIGKKSTLQEVLEWVIRVAIFIGAYMLAK